MSETSLAGDAIQSPALGASCRETAASLVMQESKPVVVVVPTAWHSPQHYSLLFDLLQKAGYAVSAQPLPSVNPATPVNVHVATDAEFVRHQQLLPLLDQGKDVLLVMHGYGGCPGGMAAKGLSKKQRSAEGVQGGVVGLVFVAGFLLLEGESVFSKLGGKFEPWHVVHVSLLQYSELALVK